jgi:uncharacterized protein (TIRG00374 family)
MSERSPAERKADRNSARNGRFKPLRRAVTVLLVFLVVEYLVIPQLPGIKDALSKVGGANLWLIGLGILLEVASLLAYAELTRAVLPKGSAPSLWTSFRIDLSTLAVSHLVPGGAAAGTGLGFRLLSQFGVAGPDIGFALTVQGVGSAVVLNTLLWSALVVSIPLSGYNPLYLTGAAVGIFVIGIAIGLVLLLTRGEVRAAKILRAVARRVPFLDEDRMHRLVHRLAGRLRALGHDRAILFAAIGWAAANWLLDAASLWVFIAAFGHRSNVVGLLVSYGLAQVLAAIPLTPGGLGVVEATLSATLVGFGVPKELAILGVISWRLFNFWLPIPLGGLAYLSLHVRPASKVPGKVLGDVAAKAAEESEDIRTWAERHALAVRHREPDGGSPASGA